MKDRFTIKARAAIQAAVDVAAMMKHPYVGTEHLLLGILKEGTSLAANALQKQSVTAERIEILIKNYLVQSGMLIKVDARGYTPRFNEVIMLSEREADKMSSDLIGTEHLLIAMIRVTECAAMRLLKVVRVNLKELYMDLLNANAIEDGASGQASDMEAADGETPTLNQYGRDLTQSAREGKIDPVIGREEEINRVMQILSRRTKNNPCLIGEPGVGKTAVVEGLAIQIAEGNVPETIKNKRLISLDLSGMVAGSKYRGEFEERIKNVISEVRDDKNVLLFIDEIHTIIGAGGAEGALDAANILKPSLARGEIQIIGATTIQEYRKHIEKDAALERRFQPVMVDEPSIEESIAILGGLRSAYEKHHGLSITQGAIEAAVNLSARYINDRFLPDKAIDLMDEAASKLRLTAFVEPKEIKKIEEEIEELNHLKEEVIKNEEYEKAAEIKKKQEKKRDRIQKVLDKWEKEKEAKVLVVGEDEIADIVSSWTKIPVKALEENEATRLQNLEKILHERVIGQDEAVTAVAKAIRRGRVGLKDPKRPIGSFLFLGPTGVGKTELSKTLADAMFGTENSLIRVDMSEYMEKHSVSKLIGSPPGYVGYDEGGQLSEKVRRNPYSIILFDEIEKAHPDIFNILLQVLDDGQITDSQGRRIDFKNTVLIMTSNSGAQNIIEPKRLGFVNATSADDTYDFMKTKVMEEVKKTFKPEFLNRIDEIVVFHALSKEHIKGIVEIMLKTISERLNEQMSIVIQVDAKAIDYLIEKGYDEKYGARPLRRTIQNLVEDRIAEEILEGNIKKGNKVKITFKKDALGFQIIKPKSSKKEEVEDGSHQGINQGGTK